ncbi:MAG: phospholipase D family protein [Gammaproteobacteria bacterium]|nr:phospholipase D family protein [Gammaproteobacteria bacterium]
MKRLRFAILAALCIAIGACASVPLDYPKEHSVAIADTSDTTIATDVMEWTDAHNGLSGFYPLVEGMDALGARLYLIEAAERSIDLQYFLMKDDTAGRIFSAALLQAADRGVRVRFLLDDVFSTVGDETLARLDQHESIEVRLYNPVARGGIPLLNFVADFKRANRRMHNKSFTVDNQVTIVGGRNIADEYFELKSDAEFLDFDVVAIGRVAADISATFDAFWNADSSVPMTAFAGKFDPDDFNAWKAALENDFRRADQSVYAAAMESELINDLVDDRISMHAATYEVITDDPSKLVTRISEEQQTLVNYLADVAKEAESEILVITPYFVPLDDGLAFWRSLTARGLRVTVVTNSLASNNHTAVHSGYSKYRRAIIEAGVELYEARVNAVAKPAGADGPDVLTLHTKAVVIDREKLFVGSLNLDPRSIDINAEMGILVNSPEMVAGLAGTFLEDLPEFAYRVELDERAKIIWRGNIDGVEVVETTEPQTSGWLRFKAFLMKIVPDSQL